MAYFRKYQLCVCGKLSTGQVYDRRNSYEGSFCAKCGGKRAAEISARERADDAEARTA